ACGGFAAICGSSVATAATFSKVAYPEMPRFGYPQSFATGVIAAGGTLGIMIPPSTVFAIYGLITEQDVGKLFIAGIVPGLLAVSMYMITITLIGHARPGFLPRGQRTTAAEKFSALKDIWATLLLFAFVIGGLYGGVVTATGDARAGAGGRLPHRACARQAVRPRHPALAARDDPHDGGGVHHPDRGALVRLFPHHHADAAEGDRVPHRPRDRQLRHPDADHADVSGARLPDG